jgi:hypothetical protein
MYVLRIINDVDITPCVQAHFTSSVSVSLVMTLISTSDRHKSAKMHSEQHLQTAWAKKCDYNSVKPCEHALLINLQGILNHMNGNWMLLRLSCWG